MIVVCSIDRDGLEIWDASREGRLVAHLSPDGRDSPIGPRSLLVFRVSRDAASSIGLPVLPIDVDHGFGLRPVGQVKLEQIRDAVRTALA